MSEERTPSVFSVLALASVGIAVVAVTVFVLVPDIRENIKRAQAQMKTQDIFTDRETGCEYVIPDRGGITPRLGRDGRPIGCGDVPEPASLTQPKRT
jgi:hypothetical protein